MLVIELVAHYLSWFLVIFLITIPKSSHSARFWSCLYLIVVIPFHFLFVLTEFDIVALGNIFNYTHMTFTEHELILYLQLSISYVFIIFRLIAGYYYVNVEYETVKYLDTISKNHKVSFYILSFDFIYELLIILFFHNILIYLQVLIESLQQISQQITQAKKDSSMNTLNLDEKLQNITNNLITLEKESSGISETLRNISNTSEKSYYWLVLVIFYLAYFLLNSAEE